MHDRSGEPEWQHAPLCRVYLEYMHQNLAAARAYLETDDAHRDLRHRLEGAEAAMGNLLAYEDQPEQLLRTVPTTPPSGVVPPIQGGFPTDTPSIPTWAGSGHRRELQTSPVPAGDTHTQGDSQPAPEPPSALAQTPTGVAATDGAQTGAPCQEEQPKDTEDPPRPWFLPARGTTTAYPAVPDSRPRAFGQSVGPDCARSDTSFDSAGSQPTTPETGPLAPFPASTNSGKRHRA